MPLSYEVASPGALPSPELSGSDLWAEARCFTSGFPTAAGRLHVCFHDWLFLIVCGLETNIGTRLC